MADRYRVGTGGNWNDTSHWSTSSGGSSGASVPGSADNAIFDSNTPTSTVTVDVAVDIVDLTCTGWDGTLDQNGNTMQISGDWTVPTTMTFTHNGLVQFDGSSVQTITMDAASNVFDDLQCSNTSADIDLGSDIRTTGTMTIDTDCRVDSTANGGNTVYIRGSGTMLVLNGWIYAVSQNVILEVNGGGTTYIPSATGWNVNGSLTGAVLTTEIIDTVTATIRLAGDIDNIQIFRIRCGSGGSGASSDVTFYSDDYDITCQVSMAIGAEQAIDSGAFESFWGSSVVEWTNNDTQTLRWQWNGATHNLQSATFRGQNGTKGRYSVYGTSTNAVDTAQTFNPGTSQVRCRDVGESWMGLGSHNGVAECDDIILSNPGSVSYVYIKVVADKLSFGDNGSSAETDVECQAEIDVGELELDATYAQQTFDFYEGVQSYVDTFDFGGTATYDLLIRSRVAGTQADVELTNAATVSYVDVQDNNLSGANVNAYDGTNTDSGNNSSNWLFTEPVQAPKEYHYRRRRT